MELAAGVGTLSVYVDGKGDTTLAVYGPNSTWFCSDDHPEGGLNPGLALTDPAPGNYNVWVGNQESGDYHAVTLKVSAGPPAWGGIVEGKTKTVQPLGAKVKGSTKNSGIRWGDDSGKWARDGECDDPRFTGPGVHSILLDSDLYKDASDCRNLFEKGRVHLKGDQRS